MRYDFKNCPKNKELVKSCGNYFVLLFTGRTGSSFIMSVLNQNSQVKFEGEWLKTFNGQADSTELQTAWIKNLFSKSNLNSYKAVGFKTKFYDIPNHEEFRRSLELFRPTILLSLRRNLLKQAISAVRITLYAEIKKQKMNKNKWQKNKFNMDLWNIFERGKGIGKTHLDIDKVNKMVLTLERSQNELEAFVRTLNLDVIAFDYEDLIEDKNLFFERMFKLLDVEPCSFETKIFKHTSNDLSEAVENYDELKAFYAGSPYEKYLTEPQKEPQIACQSILQMPQSFSKGQGHLQIDEGLLSNIEVVSFDFFDTLFKREGLFCPKDLYYKVQEEAKKRVCLNVKDFPSARIRAEENARTRAWGQCVKEITLHDIYAELGRIMNLENGLIQDLKSIELDCERSVLTPLNEGKRLFERAIADRKRVVIISDTYFDEFFLFEILKRNGFGKEIKIYASSAHVMTKAEGELYDFVLKDLACSPGKLLHIGDNPHSDFAVPLSKGMKAILLPTPKLQWRWRYGLSDRPSGNLVVSSMLCSFSRQTNLKEKISDKKAVLKKTATQHLSLLYFGFATWLLEQLEKNGYQRIYFASRDGFIMKRFFDLVAKKTSTKIDSRYLYVSRAVLYPSLIFTDPKMARVLFCQSWDQVTIADALSRIALDCEEVRDELVEYGLANLKLPLNRSKLETFRAFLKKIWPLLERKHENHFQLLIDYLQQEEVFTTEKAAFVDIGWHGSLQNCLIKLLEHLKIKKDLTGYYLGTFKKPAGATKNFNSTGYLVENDEPRALGALIHSSPSLIELFHSAGHGCVIGYKKNGIQVVPELDANPEEQKQFHSVIEPMQNIAFDFISQQLSKGAITFLQPPEPGLIARSALRMVYDPTLSEAEVFGSLKIASDFGGKMKSITGVLEYDLKKIRRDVLPDGTYPIWSPGFRILKRKHV